MDNKKAQHSNTNYLFRIRPEMNLTKAQQNIKISEMQDKNSHPPLRPQNPWYLSSQAAPADQWVRCWPQSTNPLLSSPAAPSGGELLELAESQIPPNNPNQRLAAAQIGPPGTLWGSLGPSGAPINLSGACRAPHKISSLPPLLLNSIIITTYYPRWRGMVQFQNLCIQISEWPSQDLNLTKIRMIEKPIGLKVMIGFQPQKTLMY